MGCNASKLAVSPIEKYEPGPVNPASASSNNGSILKMPTKQIERENDVKPQTPLKISISPIPKRDSPSTSPNNNKQGRRSNSIAMVESDETRDIAVEHMKHDQDAEPRISYKGSKKDEMTVIKLVGNTIVGMSPSSITDDNYGNVKSGSMYTPEFTGKSNIRPTPSQVRAHSITVMKSDQLHNAEAHHKTLHGGDNGQYGHEIGGNGEEIPKMQNAVETLAKIRAKSEVNMQVGEIRNLVADMASVANLKVRIQKKTFKARINAASNQKLNKETNLEGRRCINQFILERPLGAGSFGTVMLCRDEITNNLRAIKIVGQSLHSLTKWSKLQKNKKNVGDIQKEIAIMKKMDHPNVLHLYEVIEDVTNAKVYLILDYAKNGPLIDEDNERIIAPEKAWIYMRELILGCDYLHQNGVVHGDIKPANLLLSEDDTLMIADFGVSQMFKANERDSGDQSERESKNVSGGTPTFMSPELWDSEGHPGPPVDIWAIGVTLYKMLFNKQPFQGKTEYLLMKSIQEQEVELPENTTTELRDLLLRMLDKNPNTRITMTELFEHPWITSDGSLPLIRLELEKVEVTKADIVQAVKLGNGLIILFKLKRRLSRKLKQVRRRLSQREKDRRESEGGMGMKKLSEGTINAYLSEIGQHGSDISLNTSYSAPVSPTHSVGSSNDLISSSLRDSVSEVSQDDDEESYGEIIDEDLDFLNESEPLEALVEETDIDIGANMESTPGLLDKTKVGVINPPALELEKKKMLTIETELSSKNVLVATTSVPVVKKVEEKKELHFNEEKPWKDLTVETLSPKTENDGGTGSVYNMFTPSSKISPNSIYNKYEDNTPKGLSRMMQRNASSLSYHTPTPTNADPKNRKSVWENGKKHDESDSDESVQSFKVSSDEEEDVKLSGDTDFELSPPVSTAKKISSSSLYNIGSFSKCTSTNSNIQLRTHAASYAVQGACSYMEDRTILYPSVTHESIKTPFGLYALLDGHNGSNCCNFVQENLLPTLKKIETISDESKDEETIKKIFNEIDSQFLEIAKGREPLDTSGSCVTALFIRPNRITLGWLGDCRAILCDGKGGAKQLTIDHNPKNDEEEKRISSSGGWIANKRVNGLIAVTRSIGDIEFKTLKTESWGKQFSGELLISTPEVLSLEINDNKFIVLASDGLFEAFDNQQVVNIISDCLVSNGDLDAAVKKLIQEAESSFSELENTSCAVILFNNGKKM